MSEVQKNPNLIQLGWHHYDLAVYFRGYWVNHERFPTLFEMGIAVPHKNPELKVMLAEMEHNGILKVRKPISRSRFTESGLRMCRRIAFLEEGAH